MNIVRILSAFIFISLSTSVLHPKPVPHLNVQPVLTSSFFDSNEYQTLNAIFTVSLNYFLSPEVITSSGFPLSAFKVGDRARYGYSNPTEWGYALQAWIAAAERGVITHESAIQKIRTALTTMRDLQQNPLQNYSGLFYPYYKVTTVQGIDIAEPYQDGDVRIPSGDNALLYASLLITEGWARGYGDVEIINLAKEVKDQMEFRMFLFETNGKKYLAHQKNAITGELSNASWAIFADEGNIVAWVAYFSNSIRFDEYQALTRSQSRSASSWVFCDGEKSVVKEAAHYNAMFTWSIRSLAGFPIGSFDVPAGTQSKYNLASFVPAVSAHLAYGNCLGVDYPAFSDAMTQTAGNQPLVGMYTPPNIANKGFSELPQHVVPYALFIPFNTGAELGTRNKNILMTKINQMLNDQAGYYHSSGAYPFGFEVVASPYKDDSGYNGADEGRNIFETLSESYTILSLFNGLQLNDHQPTFSSFASSVPGYVEEMQRVLNFLYQYNFLYLPIVYKDNNSVSPNLECDLGKFRFASNVSYPEERSITINKSCFAPGENIILLENANPAQSNYWMVWDSLNMRDGSGNLIWALGKNEAPPDYSSVAFDEFDNQAPYLSDFYIGQNPTSDFPKEINDSSHDQTYLHFYVPEQAQGDFVLFLDTLYATHDLVPYFNLHVRTFAADNQ